MPRQPIELVRPTFDPGFLAQAYTSGVQAGAAVGRNRVAMAEIASRERIAGVEAALKARSLNQQERLALEGMKNETEMMLKELEEKRKDAASAREFSRQQLAEEYKLKRELAMQGPEASLAKLRDMQGAAWERIGTHLDQGGDIFDDEISGDLVRATAGSSAIGDVIQELKYGKGEGDGNQFGVGTWGRAMRIANGDVTVARQVMTRENQLIDNTMALEGKIQALKETPEIDPMGDELSKSQSMYVQSRAALNALYDEAGQAPYVGLEGTNLLSNTQLNAYNRRLEAEKKAAEKEAEEGRPGYVSQFIELMTSDDPFVSALRTSGIQSFIGSGQGARQIGYTPPYSGMIQNAPAQVVNPNQPAQGPVTNNVGIRLLSPAGPTGVRLRATTNETGAFRVPQ